MIDLKLVSYLKANLKKGYKREELENILITEGWPKKELDSAFKFIFKEKKQIKKSKQKIIQIKTKNKDPLFSFIQKSIENGISEKQIRWALATKGWDKKTVDESFKKVKFPIIKQREEEKPQKIEKQRIEFNFRKIVLYILSILLVSTILSGTSLIFLYVQGISNYAIVDDSGNEIQGACLNDECSDMREFAINYIYENAYIWIIFSIIISLFATMLYFFLPFKNGLIWVYNIFYFIFILFILFSWFKFRTS